MIPVTHPTFTNPFNGFGDCKVSYLSSVSGLVAWTDYIPVITVTASSSIEGRTEADGYQNVHPVGATGNVAWIDYIPVYEDATKTVPWSTDANGYIPVGMSEDGVLGFLSQAEFQADLTHSLVLDAGTGSPTFTRASTATFRDWEGVLKTVPSGCARFEGARMVRNLISTTSEDFSNAAWTKLSTTVVVNQAIAPDGTLTADLVHPASTGADRVVYQNGLVSLVIGKTALLVIRAKYAGIRWLWFGTLGGGTAPAQLPFFDLQNGVAGQAGTYFDAVSMEDLGDGWYECAATKNSLLAAPLFPIYGLGDADGSTTVTASGTDGIYLWDAQLEDVTGQADQTASEYVSVGVESAPYHGAGADGVEFFNTDRDGAVIPAATNTGIVTEPVAENKCLQSNGFGTTPWVALTTPTLVQDATGPNGQANYAWTMTDNDVSNYEGIQQNNVAWAAGASGCYSILVGKKASNPAYPLVFMYYNRASNLYHYVIVNEVLGTVAIGGSTNPPAYGCVSFNDDFWLVWVSGTQAGATVLATFDLYAAGSTDGTTLSAAALGSTVFADAQFESGTTEPTSRIPTTTAAVTRAADVDANPTASNILAAASTVYVEFTPDHTPSGTIALWGTYVDASNYTAILHDATNMIMRKRIAGVNYDATIANAFTANTTYKVCGSWGAAGVTVTVDGTEGTPHANTTAAQIAATMQWGADGNSLQQPFATERNARVWHRQLSASERGAVTS